MVAGVCVPNHDVGHIGGLDDDAHSQLDVTLEVQR